MCGHITSNEPKSVPQPEARPATTTVPVGAQNQVPSRTVISMGVPSAGSAEVIRPSHPAMAGSPRVADLVMLAHSLAADNAAALADCVRIVPAPAAEPAART